MEPQRVDLLCLGNWGLVFRCQDGEAGGALEGCDRWWYFVILYWLLHRDAIVEQDNVALKDVLLEPFLMVYESCSLLLELVIVGMLND
jgi:hypothetical protein